MLQTHILWYREPSLHGDHSQPGLCQQVCLLLAVSVISLLNAAITLFSSSRHHTNPVGTEWRWKMDNPETILRGALENHWQMIKQFRGECIYNM